ncbi:MAG: RpiR family transcriptional regulator, partial [Pseudomonadota bacterium]
ARTGGAKTVAITSDPDSPVALAAEIVLLTRHQGAEHIPFYGDFLEGRMSQLFIVNTLYLGTLFRCGPEAHEQLEATMRAIRQQQ